MRKIFVNLKRFEVPKSRGGLCPLNDPIAWIEEILRDTVKLGLGEQDALQLTYLLPEGLISTAVRQLKYYPSEKTQRIAIGCQGVHWENIQAGKNFGAFTSSLPAAAAAALGSQWAIIGHSEERKAKMQVMCTYEPEIETDPVLRALSNRATEQLIQAEVAAALDSGLGVLLCVGESAEERGDGVFEEQQARIAEILRAQLSGDLSSPQPALKEGRIVIGYEPLWAIGPGKTPPGAEYIRFVSAKIKEIVRENFNAGVEVVYGGGLKEENAAMLGSIDTIAGGLVALTHFTGEIGFSVPELKSIIDKYLSAIS
jgi:triosephosphate isomerase